MLSGPSPRPPFRPASVPGGRGAGANLGPRRARTPGGTGPRDAAAGGPTSSPRRLEITFDLSTLPLPIVQAPMAGGPSTPALAIAVCEAGGLGFVAAGYKRADAVRDEIRAVRAGTSAPFGVNAFVPAPEPADPDGLREYVQRLRAEAERQGAELGEPRFDDDDWEAKLDVVSDERPAVASFTFGCPDASVVDRLHGSRRRRVGDGHERRGGAGGGRRRREWADRAGNRGWRPSRWVHRRRLGRGWDRVASAAEGGCRRDAAADGRHRRDRRRRRAGRRAVRGRDRGRRSAPR